ncbi:hypothetical protein [Paenibacillus sp. SAF-068]|uniref:hypothetical protein n=1 Tax=Paenibacillus sp. SAF-068 TaxID=3436864 RepID=UPI003F7F935B
MALRADFPSGMNITARSQGERDERSFCACAGIGGGVGRQLGVGRGLWGLTVE